MKKRYLLASTAVAALASGGQAHADGMYVSVLGGANWFAEKSFLQTGTTSVNFDYTGDGFVVGGAIGTHLDKWAKGLRVELEAKYRRNTFDGHWLSSGSNTGSIQGSISNFTLMANAWYDIDIGQKFVPYVGGGAGWTRQHATVELFNSSGGPQTSASNNTVDTQANGFVWQLGAGFNYPVGEGVELGIGYRYGRDLKITGFKEGGEFGGEGFGGESAYTVDAAHHSVEVNLTIDIN